MTSSNDERPAPWRPPNPLPVERQTPRLVLRYFVPDDAASMVEALNEDRSSFLPWLPWVAVDNRTTAEAIFNVERFRRSRERSDAVPDDFVLAIADRATGAILGGTGFHRIQFAWHEAEVGYWVRPSARGRGVCTEAVKHAIDWAFESPERGGWGFRRVHIACASHNIGSRRVPEKLGLPLEARRIGQRWEDGFGWTDTLGFGITADAWPSCGAEAKA